VFGRRAAEYINDNFRPTVKNIEVSKDNSSIESTDVERKQLEVRKIVSTYANAVRTRQGLAKGKELIDDISAKADKLKLVTQEDYDYYNMVCTAKMILDGANNRKESIGAHYIEG
jgi:L-aspartate oxidase